MVIAPLSLIFLSVSCAAAWKPSDMATTRKRMRFMCKDSLGMSKNSTLVAAGLIQAGSRIAHPLGDGGEQRHAEGRVRLHQVKENLAVDGKQHGVGLGVGVGGARSLVDERHLAEDAARPDALHDGAAQSDG